MKIEIKIPNKKILIKIAAIAVVIIVILGLWGPQLILFFQTQFLPFSSGWEAVYLNNGEVYIGHIRATTDNVIKLNDAYILNVVKQEQVEGSSKRFKISGDADSSISLIKWGFYQPLKSKGELFINRANIAFWEKLDDDSEVVKQLENIK